VFNIQSLSIGEDPRRIPNAEIEKAVSSQVVKCLCCWAL